MESRLFWIIRQAIKKVWFRVVGFAIFAILTVGLAPGFAQLLPAGLGVGLASVSVDPILTILASSLLAVTTFSLSIAVYAFAAAAVNATPRATALLQEDPTTQNVLATFLGAFLFSLIGLIALRAGLFERSGQVFLFLATLVVVTLVVAALLRWISHLMTFGRMEDTLDRVERAAAESLEKRLANPYLRGNPLHDALPEDAVPIASRRTGYVQHVDVGALDDCAEALGAELYVTALPGSFVHPAAQLVWLRGNAPGDEHIETMRQAFTLGSERSFDQDPRFGLIVLSEIALRALSPAVNDPGTAISVIGRLVRVLSSWQERDDPAIDYPAIYVPPVHPGDAISDAFAPLARDGAGIIEVQIRLQKALNALTRIAPAAFDRAARELSDKALQRAAAAGATATELDLLRAAAPEAAGLFADQPTGRDKAV